MKVTKTLVLLILMLTIFICTGAKSENIVDFNGASYELKYSTKGSSGGYFNEYVKAGEQIAEWKELIVVHNFPQAVSPINESKKLAGVVKGIYAKQSVNNSAPVAVSYNEKTDTAIIDFILPIPDNKKNELRYLEFNAFKYQKSAGVKGLIAFQYSKRFFPTDLKDEKKFQEDLVNLRQTVLPALVGVKVPMVIQKEIK